MTSSAEIGAGLLAHARWKRRLRQAIKTRVSEFDPAAVGSDTACEFGKWLDSRPLTDRRSEDYKKVRALHHEFHKLAGEVLHMALSGQTDKALATLEHDGSYGQVSGRLVLAMKSWQTRL